MGASMFFDMLAILSATLWLVKLAAERALGAESAALILLALVAVRALGRAQHLSLIRMLFGIGLPLASLFVFVNSNSNGDPRQTAALLYVLGALMIVLFGYYVMFLGVFRPSKRR